MLDGVAHLPWSVSLGDLEPTQGSFGETATRQMMRVGAEVSALGSYPRGHWFESDTRYQFRSVIGLQSLDQIARGDEHSEVAAVGPVRTRGRRSGDNSGPHQPATISSPERLGDAATQVRTHVDGSRLS